jgi:hypothetical protein
MDDHKLKKARWVKKERFRMRAIVLNLECAMEASQWIGDEHKGVRDAIKGRFEQAVNRGHDHCEFDRRR